MRNARPGLPTTILMGEHKVIERMLKILNVASAILEEEEVPMEVFEETIDFIGGFADSCHHGKEEEALFPLVEERGIPRNGGPKGMMRVEHEQGRRYVKAMAEAVERYKKGDINAKNDIIVNARGYTQLLSQHIPKEDNILYPLTDRVLKASDQVKLLGKLEEIERERIGEAKHDDYILLVEKLEKQLRIS